MRRRRTMIVASALVGTSMSLTACAWWSPEGTALMNPVEHGWVTRQEMGSVFSDGMESLEVVRGPITIKDIRTIGPKGVTQVGFRLQLPTTKSPQVQLSKGFPPALPDLVEGVGRTIGTSGTKESWNVVIGYRVDEDRRWERTGVEVIYEKDGITYHQTFQGTIIVCTPSTPEVDCWDPRLGER